MKDHISVLRVIRIAALFLIGIFLFALFMSYVMDKQPTKNSSVVQGAQIGGEFELTRQDGVVITDKDIKDTAYLMFFGFTYCPDICPTELATMTRFLSMLSKEKQDALRVFFVSVDPERDTVDQMKDYMSLFHDKIEGLTGTSEQIEQIKKAYKVYSAKVETESLSDYTVDHSAYIYFFDQEGQLRHIFKTNTPEENMKQIIEPYL